MFVLLFCLKKKKTVQKKAPHLMFPAFVAETELPAGPLLTALHVASDVADR